MEFGTKESHKVRFVAVKKCDGKVKWTLFSWIEIWSTNKRLSHSFNKK